MTRRVSSRGYAMLLVLLVLLILALSMGTLVWHLSANIAETRRVITTVRTESGCASALDAAGRVITATFKENPSADPETLLNRICKVQGATCETVDGVELPRHLAAPGTTVEHFAITTTSPQRPTTRRILAGPFIDRFAVEQAVVVVVSVKDRKTGRGCTQTDRYVVPALPITMFPMFGTAPTTRWQPPFTVRRQNDAHITATCDPANSIVNGCGSRIHLNGNSGGLTTTDFPNPAVQISTDQPAINLVTSTKGTDQILRPRVAPPEMSDIQDPLLANDLTSMRWLVDVPGAADSTTQRRGRLAAQADIVIIDGVWYLNRDKNAPWPGKPIYSEHAGSSVNLPAPADGVVEATARVGLGDFGYAPDEFPKLYSWYDRRTATGPVRQQLSTFNLDDTNSNASCDPADVDCGDRGVISYGPLRVKDTGTSCTTDAACASHQECFRTGPTTGTCVAIEPGLWSSLDVNCPTGNTTGFFGVSQCTNSNRTEAMLDGSRSGFRDNGKRILPINFNVKEFVRALKSANPNELGAVLGTGGTAGDPTRFNGIVYVTTRFPDNLFPNLSEFQGGADMPAALCAKETSSFQLKKCPSGAQSDPSVHDPISQEVVPVGMCGDAADIVGKFGKQDCATASRPNALRVYGAAEVPSDIFLRGLTIVTDMPLYVYGDVNRVQTGKPHVKVALVGDRITFQSRGWRDRENPWFDPAIITDPAIRTQLFGTSTTTATGVQVIESSFITGLPMRSGSIHDLGDVFRTTQPWEQNFFILRGHIIAGYNSEWFRDVGNGDDADSDGPGDIDDQGDDVRTVADGLRWLPDFHLDNPAFQPPGMPLVSLPPTSRFRNR